MKPAAAFFSVFILTSWLLTACGGTTTPFPTLSPYALQTVIAATAQGFATPTSKPTQPLPTLSPTPTPSALLPPTFPPPPSILGPDPAERIEIPDGSTTWKMQGNVRPGEVKSFVLAITQGQALLVAAQSESSDVSLSIKTRGGTSLLSPNSKQTSWQGMVPITTEYYISLLGGGAPEEYSLSIELPIPIKFKVGEDTVIYSGKITDGNTAVYSLFTIPGQKIHVSLNGVGKLAVLVVSGFGDGTQYIKASDEETEFKLEAEALKDYVIKIAPTGSAVVNYTLIITIKQ